jgi:hypothetical protein
LSFTRKKKIAMDGIEVEISPLTCAQADEFLTTQNEIVESDADQKTKVEKLKSLSYRGVADGLNNAGRDPKMTGDGVRAELDKVLIATLWDEILSMSGILIPKQNQGEAPAP